MLVIDYRLRARYSDQSPDRWIVVRLVENAKFSCQTLSSSGHLKRDGFEYGDPSPPGIGSEVFVIERNHVRQVQETPPDDDLLTSTSAYIDPPKLQLAQIRSMHFSAGCE